MISHPLCLFTCVGRCAVGAYFTVCILVLQLEWRLEHAISEEIRKETTKNCNSRVELCFPVMLDLSPRMDLFFMYGEESCALVRFDMKRKVSRHSERHRVHLVVSLARDLAVSTKVVVSNNA